MTTEDKNIYTRGTEELPETHTDVPESGQEAPEAPARKSGTWPVVAFVLAVAAWIALVWNGYLALGISAMGLIASFVAVRRRRGAWRNLAITALIASAVLFVVVTAFIIVIFVGLKSV